MSGTIVEAAAVTFSVLAQRSRSKVHDSMKEPHSPKQIEATAATGTTSRISIGFDHAPLKGAAGGFLSRGHEDDRSKKSRSNSIGRNEKAAQGRL